MNPGNHVPKVLMADNPEASPPWSCTGTDPTLGLGEVQRDTNDRRSSADHRWSQGHPVALYATAAGTPSLAAPAASVAPRATPAPGYPERRSDSI